MVAMCNPGATPDQVTGEGGPPFLSGPGEFRRTCYAIPGAGHSRQGTSPCTGHRQSHCRVSRYHLDLLIFIESMLMINVYVKDQRPRAQPATSLGETGGTCLS